MGLSLKKIIPWGRSFEEYVSMFTLTEDDLCRRILGCGDGPASFNAVLTQRGGRVISVDPLYLYSVEMIRARIDESYDHVLLETRKNRDDFLWKEFCSVEELGERRMAAMATFLRDFAPGNPRYAVGELPLLSYPDNAFDLALCSHLLFLYSEHLSLEFHISSIREMLRVAREVRIFPLVDLNGNISTHLEKAIGTLQEDGYDCRKITVSYEFQRGGNEMLQLKAG